LTLTAVRGEEKCSHVDGVYEVALAFAGEVSKDVSRIRYLEQLEIDPIGIADTLQARFDKQFPEE